MNSDLKKDVEPIHAPSAFILSTKVFVFDFIVPANAPVIESQVRNRPCFVALETVTDPIVKKSLKTC